MYTINMCPKCGWGTLKHEEDNDITIEQCWIKKCGYFKIELKEGIKMNPQIKKKIDDVKKFILRDNADEILKRMV